MELNVVIFHVTADPPRETERAAEIDEKTTIQELLNQVGAEWADLSDYYPLSGAFTWNDPVLPYLLVDGKILYSVGFDEAKVKDFLETHGICDNRIRVVTGYPWAGGPGFLELAQIWDNLYPILNAAALFFAISGFSLKDFYHAVRAHFMQKGQPPHTCFDIVFSRKGWNAMELAELLEMEPQRAKELLRLLDYQYDRARMQYIQGQRSGEIRDKLKSVKIHDI